MDQVYVYESMSGEPVSLQDERYSRTIHFRQNVVPSSEDRYEIIRQVS